MRCPILAGVSIPRRDGIRLRSTGRNRDRINAAGRVWAGNFLFSTGPNTQGGGTRDTKGHYDVPMRDCTVILDGDVIIDQGKFVDKKMIVERVER